MSVEKIFWGKSPQGQEIYLYTMKNGRGMSASVTDLGAILVKLLVPDQKGQTADVVLGYDSPDRYYDNSCFFGATIGPSANRIAGAKFSIAGKEYQLSVNDNANNLHSHMDEGYHKRIWKAEAAADSVTFSLEDDATMGFPAKKSVSVVYTLTEENELEIRYHISADGKTLINPTNHTYFNLAGHESGKIEGHELTIYGSCYTPVVAGAIPTGEIATVKGTPMDFTTAKRIGKEINADFEQLKLTGGYDHNWIIDGWDGSLKHFAEAKDPVSGRVMECYTTLPGVQFYAGNFIEEAPGKGGVKYGARHGFCLETQYYPDNVHHDNFPQAIFGGEKGDYDSVTVYRFA